MCTMRQRMSNGVALVPLHEHEEFQKWCLSDAPKQGKGALLTRAISFKDKFGRQLGGIKSPRQGAMENAGGEPAVSGESVQDKVEALWRSLNFSKYVVTESTFYMLPGWTTAVLEAVFALMVILKPKFTNQNRDDASLSSIDLRTQSSAVSSVISGVHQSLAELVRWSDQRLLYEDDTHNTQSIQDVVKMVKEAVQALIDLAADKENLYISDSSMSPSTLDNNNSIDKSLGYYSNRSSEISNHRNSLPEIKQDSPIEQNSQFLQTGDNLGKLSHSRSSDSILAEVPPPKPALPNCTDKAPPLPPKIKRLKANLHEPFAGHPHTSITSPVGHSSRENSSDWLNHSHGPHSLSETLERCSLTNSSDQVSPASSQDSMNHPHDDPPASRTSLDSSGSLYDRSEVDSDFNKKLSNTSFDALAITRGDANSIQKFSSSSSRYFESDEGNSEGNSLSCPHSQLSKRTCESSSVTVLHSSKITCTQHTFRSTTTTTTRSSTSSSTSSSSSASELGLLWSQTSYYILGCLFWSGRLLPCGVPSLPVLITRTQGDKYDGSDRSASSLRVQDRQRFPPSRAFSTYDNLDQGSFGDSHVQDEGPSPKVPPKTRKICSSSSSSISSGYETRGMSVVSSSSQSSCSQENSTMVHMRRVFTVAGDDNPPPLPEKKKHVHDYMRLFGQVAEPNPNELLRHSVHQIHLDREAHYTDNDHEQELFRLIHVTDDKLAMRPALPPKKRTHKILTRQSSPPSSQHSTELATNISVTQDNSLVLAENNTYRKSTEEKEEPEEVIIKDQSVEVERHNDMDKKKEVEEEEDEEGLLDLLDVREYLILKKEGEEGPEIRGGPVDALIVHASKANKNDLPYQEAFLTTYRTFISPDELVDKLLKRYNKFISNPDIEKQKAARNAFALLVRVVDDLTVTDLSTEMLKTVTDFEYGLLCRGELLQARFLRMKIVEKFDAKKKHNASKENYSPASLSVSTRNVSLLDFKAQEIAEQMTLLDAELFLMMEIPEVLLWSREQNEEKAPNLTRFTEHFNKMSFWARTRILEQEEEKIREKYVLRFTKIMKYLRKFNNFNSYLALLSALDSAPVRRLEWQKNITDGLKEYCLLIDSSCSFRAYRQALSDSSPPCIPYIGLILQDLTFVNIGNNDLLPDSNVNFSKRWQQFNILQENMKRFKNCSYNYKKNEKIISFLNNFDNYRNEEALWSISESIKPRGGKKK
ncbi:guanine nucleotide-releasing factor 2-like isoform X12 [Eriocheir sinensis]|uniref:guanine nucleotide-releasing factor 2-like isoform X12 n=1 Tax=Eriocheir sinensis TaxID=95602 RepID=UPI0021C81865|nr:guanine nucleotide-releasing factor 2-like isoform X12 [Eriocheir sinensis]XP_050688272.1 guanine nucleotide-releasing factor 2-like isoform X12 [Eriocheir sinensis]XP_050688273.1 guanine nucleotide-releasing factor 2-like isoform X12 [Eriocheir sinensis]XP_050688274.1 guanine nucleotide-releasing factor 2-like isoform X12 [Eriocheir sinensis]